MGGVGGGRGRESGVVSVNVVDWHEVGRPGRDGILRCCAVDAGAETVLLEVGEWGDERFVFG